MKRKLVVAVVATVALVTLVLLTQRQLNLEQLARYEIQLRQAIDVHPWISLATALAAYYVVSLVPGSSGKSIVIGWLFGFWLGVLIVDVALTAAALTTFALSRYVLREAVEGRMQVVLLRLNQALEEDGAFYMLTLRMFHVPYSLVNFSAGASRVGAWTFGWTTSLGLLPGTLVFVLAGTRLPTLKHLLDEGIEELLDPSLMCALVLMGFAPLVLRRMVQWLRGVPQHGTLANHNSQSIIPRR